MTCEEYRELISADYDGELNESDRAALNAHLAECEECRAYAEALRSLSELLTGDLPSPGEDFTAAVMDKVRAEAAGKKKLRRLPLKYISLAASFVLLVGVGLYAGGIFPPKAKSADSERADAPMLMMADSAAVTEEENYGIMFAEAAPAPAEGAPVYNGANDFAPAAAPAAGMAPKTEATAEETAVANFLPQLNAGAWLHQNRADADEWVLEDYAWTDTLPAYESVLPDYTSAGDVCLVTYRDAAENTLTLLLDTEGTVFGIIE